MLTINYLKNRNTLYSPADLLLLQLEKQGKKKLHNLISLQPEFMNERLAETFLRKHYLTRLEREQYRAHIKDNQCFDLQGQPLNGEYIFALLPDNRLYIARESEVKHHSYLIAGLPAKAIGKAYFCDGKLITLSNDSGHYKPKPEQMLLGLCWFLTNFNSNFIFEDHSRFNKQEKDFGLRHFNAFDFIQSLLQKIEPTPLTRLDIFQILHYMLSKLNITALHPLYETINSRYKPDEELIKKSEDIRYQPNEEIFDTQCDKDTNSKYDSALEVVNKPEMGILVLTGLDRQVNSSNFTKQRRNWAKT